MRIKLKILCIWLVEYGGKLSYEQYNVFPSLVRLGCKVKFYMLEKINADSLIDAVVNFKPDVILFKPYADRLRPELLRHITYERGFTTVGWMGDDEKYLDHSLKYVGSVSWIATNLKSAQPVYKAHNQKSVWFPYAANEKLFKKVKAKKEFDCSFVGAIRPTRVFYLNKLANAGLWILVKGKGWKTDDSALVNVNDYVSIINRTKVNLNISEDLQHGNKLVYQVKGRDFEVPMAGGFLLTKDSDQIREFYKPDKEIVVYKDFNEFIDKAKYYVKHDDKREKIAQAGHRRALKCHTYENRLTQLFKEVT